MMYRPLHKHTAKLSWASRWLAQFLSFGAGQIIVQLLTAVSGFLSVRWLSKQEYAFFSIATSLQFLVCHFSDMGVSVGVNAIGGRVWNDANRFGSLLNTARRERIRVASVASMVVVPFVFLLLIRQRCGYGYAAILTVFSLAAGLAQMENGVFSLAPRFHGQLQRLRKLDVSSSVVRLGALASLLFVLPLALVPVAVTSVISYTQLLYYRKWSAQLANRDAKPDHNYRSELRRVVLRLMPSGIFYAFQGQLAVALIAFYGTTGAVADVGALNRLGMIFAVIGTTVSTVLMPPFSKIQAFRLLVIRFWLIFLPVVCFAACVVGVASLYPRQCLWLLGGKYQNLEREVPIVAINGALVSIQGTVWGFLAARAWVEWAWMDILVTSLTLAIFIPLLDVHTVHGILLLGCCSQLATVISNLCMVRNGFKRFWHESQCLEIMQNDTKINILR